MKCKNCGETYDPELFPVCPYCLTANYNSDDNTCDSKDTEHNASITIESEPVVQPQSPDDELGEISAASKSNDVSIDMIPCLHGRSKNILIQYGVQTLGQLKAFVANNDLTQLPYVGSTSIGRILQAAEYTPTQEECSTIGKAATIEDRLAITDAFDGGRYNLFVKFCEQHGYRYIDELAGFDFQSLNAVDGMGKTKVSAVIERYLELVKLEELPTIKPAEDRDTAGLKLFVTINDELKGENIDFIRGFGIRSRLAKLLSENGFNYLGDLEGVPLYKLESIVSRRNVDSFIKIQELLELSFFDAFEHVLEGLSKEEAFSFALKKAAGATLQRISEEKGVTRERIRQIIKKFFSKLDPFMNRVVKQAIDSKGYITAQELIDIYDNDDFDIILVSWCRNAEGLCYLRYADTFIPHETENAINKKISEFANEYVLEGATVLSIEDMEVALSELGLEYLDYNAFINYLHNNEYQVYGNYIVKGKPSYGYLCARMVAKYFPDGIKLNDSDDLDLLRSYTEAEYGKLRLPQNDYALSSRLSNFTVLRGRGLVTAEENVHVEMELLDELENIINNSPHAEIYYSELYAKYEGLITMMSNIDNHYFLHGVLKLYFSDKYDFGNRDYLTKRGDGFKTESRSVRLNDYIISVGRPVTKHEILRKFPGMTDVVLNSLITGDKNIIKWGTNMYYSLSCVDLSKGAQDYLSKCIDLVMAANKGYCNDMLLFDLIKRDNSNILTMNWIDKPSNLFYLCASLFDDDYIFRHPHIARKGLLQSLTARDIALHFLDNPDSFTYEEFIENTEKLKWSHSTAGLALAELSKDYIRISKERYISKSTFVIEPGSLELIRECVISKMKEGYLSLIRYDDWDSYPRTQYEWNEFYLRSLIDNYMPDLRVIEAGSSDRRSEKGIVVKRLSDIENYEDLVVHFMTAKKLKTLPENDMLAWLLVHRLALKVIPKELYYGRTLKYRENMFFLG